MDRTYWDAINNHVEENGCGTVIFKVINEGGALQPGLIDVRIDNMYTEDDGETLVVEMV